MNDTSSQHQPPTTRRQRRIRRRRHEIMDAAAQVFADQGYAGSTTKQIAKAADIAEGTLYNYFKSKRDILLAIVRETQTGTDAVLAEAQQLHDRDDMVALVERWLELFASRLPFTRILITEAWVNDAILKNFVQARLEHTAHRIQAFIIDHIEAGVFRPVAPELVTRMVMGMFLGLSLPALRGVTPPPSPQERRALAEMAVDLLLDGVRVREA